MENEIYVGIDVSAKKFDVSVFLPSKSVYQKKQFSNNSSGHAKLCSWLKSIGKKARICLEATGIYSLDLAICLKEANFAVMVCNPRLTKNFHSALGKRGKTDAIDAKVLCQYCQKMDFVEWGLPEPQLMELRTVTRRIRAIKKDLAAELNRRHRAKATETTPAYLLEDIESSIKLLRQRIRTLIKKCKELIDDSETLKRKFEILLTVPGIAIVSALYLIGEICCLQGDLDVKQLVAHAGLDPRPFQSGTSINGKTIISKKGNKLLRKALFFPAMVAIQRDDTVKKFYVDMLHKGKEKMQAIIAVMRKMLHAIFGMFKHNAEFDASMCFAR